MTSPTNLSPADAVIKGEQRPRISLLPEHATSLLGDQAVQLAAMAGLYLDDWQQFVLRHSLGERNDGKWAAFEVGLCVSRQNGKNALLEARELAELFLVRKIAGPRTILHSAHLFSTSLEHFRRLSQRIRDTPDLAALVKRRGSKMIGIRESHGEESIELEDGSRIIFAARTKGGRRGFTLDLVVWDEAMELPGAVVGAVLPTVSAKTGPQYLPGPQVWYTGSAVNQANLTDLEYGVQFSSVRARGIAGEDPALAYFEWSAPEGSDPTDPRAWAQGNPGLGIRITLDYVRRECAAMPASEFAVERLGVGDWVDLSEDVGRVITREAWALAARGAAPDAIPTAFAVDVNPERTWGSIGEAREISSGWQFSVLTHRRGTDWIREGCRTLHAVYPDVPFVILGGRAPAANLITEIEADGINVVQADTHDYGIACADWFDLVTHGNAHYPPPQDDLTDALAGARKSAGGENAWTWSRKASTSPDISPLVAVTLALWGSRNAESEYASAIGGEPILEEGDGELIGAQAPVFLTEGDLFDCFACRVLGHRCELHATDPEGDA
jgi:hypothetical protein